MSSYGPGGPGGRVPRRPGRPNTGWSLLIIAAALIGGLAGDRIEHASLVITVLVSLAVGAIVAFLVVQWPGQPLELTGGRPDGQERGLPGRPSSEPSRPESEYPRANPELARGNPSQYSQTRVGPRNAGPETEYPKPEIPARSESVVELMQFSSQRDAGGPPQQGADWWQQPVGPPPSTSSAGRSAPAPDLSSYLDSAVIAQCPRCGAFDLDIDNRRDPWAFRCRACGQTWAWQPGSPWPPVRVAPRQRGVTRPRSP